MDPLSVTASIIAVLQATNAIISVCYNYGTAAKNSSREQLRVTEELKSLRGVLEALELLARKAERGADPVSQTRLPTLKLLCEPGGGQLAECLGVLKTLQEKLVPPSQSGQNGSKRKAAIQALCWPLKEGDIKRTLENIGRFKATLNLAITADEGTMILAIQDTTLDTQKDLVKFHQSFVSTRIDDQLEKIHRWLSAPDPSLNHNEARRKWQERTGVWFTRSKQFADWKTTSNSFLWLHGIPGCGKTILSSTIVEDVLRHCGIGHYGLHPASAVVYFYFDFNDIWKQRHETMVRSLITQLSLQRESARRALESLFSSCISGSRQPTIEALLATLQCMVREFDETYIILDALDECKERKELLANIKEIAGWGLQKLHILATSRRERDIEASLENLIHIDGGICIQDAIVNGDIRTYVHERLQTDPGLQRWRKQQKVLEEIETTLVEKAHGMFRWAVCQLDTLEKCLNLHTLRKALASLPKTLDETYARILCSIDEEYSEDALKILQWLSYSARPLQIEELAEVIAVDIEGHPRFDSEKRIPEPRDILTICSSLVTTTAETTGDHVRLAHFSVKEYLVSDRIRTGLAARYSIREENANLFIAAVCLAYLLRFDSPNSLIVQTDEEFPLAGYAASYWTQHARVAEKDTSVIDLIMELFLSNRDAYVNWIRVFDPDRPWGDLNLTERSMSVPSPLYYAALGGLVESARLLLEKGLDVNAHEGRYGSALLVASDRGHEQIVQLLLEKGADINLRGAYGSALQLASDRGHEQIVQLLLEKGADINAGGRYGNALQLASIGGHERIVQMLLEKGAGLNERGSIFCNALNAAFYCGHDRIARLLLENRADVNAQRGFTFSERSSDTWWSDCQN